MGWKRGQGGQTGNCGNSLGRAVGREQTSDDKLDGWKTVGNSLGGAPWTDRKLSKIALGELR